MFELTPEDQFALEATRQAALLVAQIESDLVSAALTKEDRSPVTVADYAAQAVVAAALERAFPADRLVAEEDSGMLRQSSATDALRLITQYVRRVEADASENRICDWIERGNAPAEGRFWTLDPLDGTKGFLRGDQYAVAFALIEAGVVQLGVLACPKLSSEGGRQAPADGALVIARRGQGAWLTSLRQPHSFRRLQVSEQRDIRQARLLRSFESGHTDAERIEALAAYLNLREAPLRLDSQAKTVLLADGQGELMLRLLSPDKPDYREKIWDQAAGSLILEEAGGKISDLRGKALDFSQGRTLRRNRGVLASNGVLHEAALMALRAVGAVPPDEA
jgi:3'(2'), 5'-bisphosphate nucleotidase